MEVLGKKRRKRGRREGEKERIDASRGECGKAWIDGRVGSGGGPTALVAVERTNFVLIEKSPALNPIYKPANMAGVGRSLARSLVSPSSYRAFRSNPDTQLRRDLSQSCTTYPG